jgi:hypothetical protein
MGKTGKPWLILEPAVPPWVTLAVAVVFTIVFGLLWLSFLIGVYRFFTRRPPR